MKNLAKKIAHFVAVRLALTLAAVVVLSLGLALLGVLGKHTKEVSAQGVETMKQIEESLKPTSKTSP